MMEISAYKAEWCRYTLDFTFEARTSRGSMLHKDTYFIRVTAPSGRQGVGEVPLFKGLSQEDGPGFERLLAEKCRDVVGAIMDPGASSIAFGIASALASISQRSATPWQLGHRGIPINGLVWMGDKYMMRKRITEKLDQGFKVIKLKIGGIDFNDELDLIADIRRHFNSDDVQLRVDANGAFTPDNVMEYMDRLAPYGLHSIEQPIRAGQVEAMAEVCRRSPIPVALDEELIGLRPYCEKVSLIENINPQYVVLKPALCGGFADCEQYMNIVGPGRWWVTSALESNIGLYAIASWLSHFDIDMAQGLGTGMLYSNNIFSPLSMHDAMLWCEPRTGWQNLEDLPWHQ